MREVLVKNEEFKDSPVGRIPQDWETVTLKDEINLLHGYAFEGKYFSDRPPGEILLVPGNFHREGGLYFDENNTKYYQGVIPNNTILNNGDLLIVMTDLSPRTLILGRVVQLELPFKVLHNQRIGKIILKLPDTWDKRFLMLVMNSDRVRRNIISNATGTTVRHTSPDRIIANVVPKPNRQEQSKIAEILDTVDEAIARTSSLIIKLKQTKAGLLQDLLTRGLDEDGKLRDPQTHPEQFKDSPLGQIPKDWEVKPLSELADVDRGKFTHRPRNDPRFYNGSYPFIQTGDITKATGGIITTYSQTLNERGITVSREFPINTIAITIAANIADTAILGIPMFFPDSVVGAVVKAPNSVRYVELCIRCAKQHLDARAPQSAQKNINLEDLRPLLIAVPEATEQHKIAQIYEGHSTRICTEEAYLNKLKHEKQGLMQDLLTGKVRVKSIK